MLRFPGIRFRLGNRRTCSWSHDRDAASSQAPPRARWFRSSAFLKALERLAGEPRRDGAFEWEVFEDLSQEGTSVLNRVPLVNTRYVLKRVIQAENGFTLCAPAKPNSRARRPRRSAGYQAVRQAARVRSQGDWPKDRKLPLS